MGRFVHARKFGSGFFRYAFVAHQKPRRGAAIAGAELLKGGGNVRVDGGGRQAKLMRDFVGSHRLGNEAQTLRLARRQPCDSRAEIVRTVLITGSYRHNGVIDTACAVRKERK